MINRAVILGRLTADPELRQTQSGVGVLSFTVAVDSRFSNQNGERQTNFIYCVAWRHTAEFISKYFTKGQMIGVDGSLQSRNYVDKNGNNRSVLELIVENVSFCGSKAENAAARSTRQGFGGGSQQGQSRQGVSSQSAASESGSGVGDGDSFSVGDLESVEGFEEIGTDDSDLPF